MVGNLANSLLNYLWQNKIWRITVWSLPHAIKFWSSVTCIYFTYVYIATIFGSLIVNVK